MSINTSMAVAGTTDARNLAESIRMGFRDGAGNIELQAVGAAAVNQAVKAVAIVRRQHKLPVVMVPSFVDIERADGEQITGMKLDVMVGPS